MLFFYISPAQNIIISGIMYPEVGG